MLRDNSASDPHKVHYYADQVDNLQLDLNAIYEKVNLNHCKMALAQKHFESNRCKKYYFRLPGVKNDAIKCICKGGEEQVYVTDQMGILNECREYYDRLYIQPHLFSQPGIKEKFLSRIPKDVLSLSDKASLDQPLTLDELYNSLKVMNIGAVLGEDGLTVNFYITFWDLVKDFLYASYLHAFDTGFLSITQRRGLIRLLPKKDKNPLFVSSWRPISLLNVDYKILTKLFARRLSKFLPNLVHKDQKGFIAGRSIHENLLDIQALLSACDNLNTEGILILLDFQKAFDSIGWSFIRSVLVTFQFPESFLRWFDIFYARKELRIINNGYMSAPIFPSRGVTQGCGISPLFFVLALEILALAIRDNPLIKGISIHGVSKKINLLADDGLLALRWTQASFEEMVKVLAEFESFSNLTVNKHKSLIVRIGRNKEKCTKPEGSESFPYLDIPRFCYLGVDWVLMNGRYDLNFNFDPVVDKVKNIIKL